MIEFQPRKQGEALIAKVQEKNYPEEIIVITRDFSGMNELMNYIMDVYWYKVGKNKRMYYE